MKQNITFNHCDQCDEEDGGYYSRMFYNNGRIMCKKGHVEDFNTHFRHETKESMTDHLIRVLNITEESHKQRIITNA